MIKRWDKDTHLLLEAHGVHLLVHLGDLPHSGENTGPVSGFWFKGWDTLKQTARFCPRYAWGSIA
jgi:hypothetical protein